MAHYTYIDLVNRMISARHLCVGNTGEKTAEFTSYDRKSRYENGEYLDWAANADGGQYLADTEDGGCLIAEMDGPGYISRIWSATAGPGHVKIYIDGAAEPTVDLEFREFFNCTKEPFVYRSLGYDDSARGKNCYVPISYNRSCRIVAYGGFGDDGWGKYYHINYTTFPTGTTVESMPYVLSAEQKAALQRVDSFFAEKMGTHPEGAADAPFERYTVAPDAPAVKTLVGKGAIYGVLVRLHSDAYDNSIETIELLKNLRVRMYWDGEQSPRVDAPLGDFFASAYGKTKIRTALLGIRDDGVFYNYFYMPFLDSARIEIATVGDYTASLDLSVTTWDLTVSEKDILYFCARFNLGTYIEDKSRWPDYSFLRIQGAGRFVGVTLHNSKLIDGADPCCSPGWPWWGEGDEKFYIDGEKFPSWFGTGTEDFFGYAWCSPALFTKPYHAQSYCEGLSNFKGNRSVTRIMLGDSIAFEKSFDGYLEKYYSDEFVHYGFTPYYYLAKDSIVENCIYASEEKLDYYLPEASAYATNYTEGEHLHILQINSENGTVQRQHMPYTFGPLWSGDYQMMVKDFRIGDSVTAALPAATDGEYTVLVSYTSAPDYGIVSCTINGIPLATTDLYSEKVTARNLLPLGNVTLHGGYDNTVTFTVMGKNALATNTFFGIDFVMLVPKAEYTSPLDIALDVYRENTKYSACPTRRIEAEALAYNARRSGGGAMMQPMLPFGEGWSGGVHLLWSRTEKDAWMRLPIVVGESGDYDITLGMTKAADYGILRFSVNGAACSADFDGYDEKVLPAVFSLGQHFLHAGVNELLLTVIDKNDAATNYFAGIDYIDIGFVSEKGDCK